MPERKDARIVVVDKEAFARLEWLAMNYDKTKRQILREALDMYGNACEPPEHPEPSDDRAVFPPQQVRKYVAAEPLSKGDLVKLKPEGADWEVVRA